MKTPDAASTWLALMRTHQAMDRVARKSMEKVGLGFSDFTLLEALLHLGPLMPGQLVKILQLTKGSVTSAIDRLEARALLRRKAHFSDARSVLVELSPKGRQLISPAYDKHHADLVRVVDRALDEKQQQQLFKLLLLLRKSAQMES